MIGTPFFDNKGGKAAVVSNYVRTIDGVPSMSDTPTKHKKYGGVPT